MRRHDSRQFLGVVVAVAVLCTCEYTPSRGSMDPGRELPSMRLLASSRGFLVGADVVTDGSLLAADTLYRHMVATQYNSVSPDNATLFAVVHPQATQYAFSDLDLVVGFAKANGMVVDGHNLVWDEALPGWITSGSFTRASLLAVLHDHIATVVGRYRGKIANWDVVNEVVIWNGTLRPGIWLNTIGPEYIDSAFIWARRADPTAKLYLNEYQIEGENQKSDSVLALVERLRARGVPIDGVAFQAHSFPASPLPSEDSVRVNFARFAKAGFLIRISEMDVMIPDTAGPGALVAQAVVFRDMLDACLLQPQCAGFTTWGLTDRYSSIPSAWPGFGRGLPLDSAYLPKPAFDSLVARLRRL
jgi:endo-1,4-beta-xylanase